MKQFLRPILCGGVLAALLCTPSLAADEGDFSLLVRAGDFHRRRPGAEGRPLLPAHGGHL